jgi:hypothetical protein
MDPKLKVNASHSKCRRDAVISIAILRGLDASDIGRTQSPSRHRAVASARAHAVAVRARDPAPVIGAAVVDVIVRTGLSTR